MTERLECSSALISDGTILSSPSELFVLTCERELKVGHAILHFRRDLPLNVQEVEVVRLENDGVTKVGRFDVSQPIGHGAHTRALLHIKSSK